LIHAKKGHKQEAEADREKALKLNPSLGKLFPPELIKALADPPD
jgi:hypothetical protein